MTGASVVASFNWCESRSSSPAAWDRTTWLTRLGSSHRPVSIQRQKRIDADPMPRTLSACAAFMNWRSGALEISGDDFVFCRERALLEDSRARTSLSLKIAVRWDLASRLRKRRCRDALRETEFAQRFCASGRGHDGSVVSSALRGQTRRPVAGSAPLD